MIVLVINCGSSSLKVDVIDSLFKTTIISLRAERILTTPQIEIDKQIVEYTGNATIEDVLRFSLLRIQQILLDKKMVLNGIGHRVVHGGRQYSQPVLIDETVEQAIVELSVLAPLHNPANVAGVRIAKELFPSLDNIAVFDTAFHNTLPNRAKYYAINKEMADKYQIQRYGFHGTSHKYIMEKVGEYMKDDVRNLRILSCHLGNGASICAIEFGRSIEISSGMTPLEGLMMGTRSGDIDPGVDLYLQEKENWTPE